MSTVHGVCREHFVVEQPGTSPLESENDISCLSWEEPQESETRALHFIDEETFPGEGTN